MSSNEGPNEKSGAQAKGISPSAFMRARRPEYYSDTKDRTDYSLDRATLENHLSTITNRNETHEFEIFCRKLCERTICPFLRPHSGPEGGGDGKTDSETIPVANEISDLTYIGEANAGESSLAFAFSAKEKWTDKVRSDVKGIAETRKAFDRIYFVTSQFARAKTVSELEQKLEAEYGTPLTILDRSWIVEQIIDQGRKDIAYHYLGIGQPSNDPLRLGPTDYSRTQQLTDIERQLDDPAAFEGMERQRVTEALVAAKLSRYLEMPRFETEGRFARAIRLAKADGSYRQKLETQYEALWTAVWWFDDLQQLNESYDSFATQAIDASHIRNLEFLSNLLQLLFNAVIHDGLTREESKLDERAAQLRSALQAMAEEPERPNNSLEARLSLLLMQLNFAIVEQNEDQFPSVWRDLGAILDEAEGLGEFPAQRVAELIEAMGDVAGNDPDYNDLIEKLADFIANRESEASGGLTLLKRAEKLDTGDHFEIIRFAGRAATRLVKKEHTASLVRALQLLTVAYRKAGLLWVARASCVFVAASILMEAEEGEEIPISFIPTMKIWAWLSLELGHLPDVLYSLQMLNGARAMLPLSDETMEVVGKDIEELDYALGALVLNATDEELAKLSALPDVLDGLNLTVARTSLLYILGREDDLRAEGSIPQEETPEGAREMMSLLASQPVVAQSADRFIFNKARQQTTTRLLGLLVEIQGGTGENALLAAELIATSLEAFFATLPEQEIIPHLASFRIVVDESDDAIAPSFEIGEFGTEGRLIWPAGMMPYLFSSQSQVRELVMDINAKLLAHAFMVPQLDELLTQLYSLDAVQGRLAMTLASGNSYHRLTNRYISTLEIWSKHNPTNYLVGDRPTLNKVDLTPLSEVPEKKKASETSSDLRFDDHRDVTVKSVIDVQAWDQAKWRGSGYLDFGNDKPPAIALLFENEGAARHIFSRWIERFGEIDEGHDIHVAIIRHHDEKNPTHYIMQIAAKPPSEDDFKEGQGVVLGSRCIENTPPDNINLDHFTERHALMGCYWIMPAIVQSDIQGKPNLLSDLAILKRDVSYKSASEVSEFDVEAIALRQVLNMANEA
ncbi:hypothetical protein [uncultured Erythrobacter sp.]|uniref:hypothetical protein n=1 Tax=uncultured Erythrobacter sp. TaxID=263913 RepID=UPI0026167326|nr:hypothetical protein [uncultured Erythrobacter sp.]